jgi:hypothetical protein
MSDPAAPSVALHTVVLSARTSFEHLIVEGHALTLCGRAPGHINPPTVTSLPDRSNPYSEDFCRKCLRMGRLLLDSANPRL